MERIFVLWKGDSATLIGVPPEKQQEFWDGFAYAQLPCQNRPPKPKNPGWLWLQGYEAGKELA